MIPGGPAPNHIARQLADTASDISVAVGSIAFFEIPKVGSLGSSCPEYGSRASRVYEERVFAREMCSMDGAGWCCKGISAHVYQSRLTGIEGAHQCWLDFCRFGHFFAMHVEGPR